MQCDSWRDCFSRVEVIAFYRNCKSVGSPNVHICIFSRGSGSEDSNVGLSVHHFCLDWNIPHPHNILYSPDVRCPQILIYLFTFIHIHESLRMNCNVHVTMRLAQSTTVAKYSMIVVFVLFCSRFLHWTLCVFGCYANASISCTCVLSSVPIICCHMHMPIKELSFP